MRIIKSTFASANSISLYQSDAPKWCAKCSRYLFSICASQQRSILKLPPSNRRVTDEYRQVQTGNRRLQTSNRRLQTGNRRLQTGNRRLQTGNRRLQTSYRRLHTSNGRVNFLNTTDNIIHASSYGYGNINRRQLPPN